MIHKSSLSQLIDIRALCANEWMHEMEEVLRRKSQGCGRDGKLIKIAVLDTGIDTEHNVMRAAKKLKRIKDMKSFVQGDKTIKDFNGHGTHITALLLKIAPHSQLYIAKVARGSKIPEDHSIAEVSSSNHSLKQKRLTLFAGNRMGYRSGGRYHHDVFRYRQRSSCYASRD